MKVERIDNFPAGTNVFDEDLSNMGTFIGQRTDENRAGTRVIVMHRSSGKDFPLEWIIVADEVTGSRLKITF